MKRSTSTVSMVTCPECGHTEALPSAVGAARLIHRCAACGVLSRPKQGDCCVLCSYGDRACEAAGEIREAEPA
jgi:hypothetical protein